MIPVTDSVPVRRTPYVTLSLIGACVVVFLWELGLGPALDPAIRRFGFTPRLFFLDPAGVWFTLITHQFLHAGWAHLLANMLFLWIFGDNVEDRLGHLPYLVFYLACGAGAALVQAAASPLSPVPMVGASGAIAGVLGAYLVFYPGAWVMTLVPMFFFLIPLEIPALIFLPLWFLSQLLSGLAAISRVPATGGVAFWAHAGGFVLGAALGAFLAPFTPAPVGPHRPQAPTPPAARLISTLADILALAILARFFLILFAPGVRGPGQAVIGLLFSLTGPLVEPFFELVPILQLGRLRLELPSLAAALTVHLLGGLVGWALGLGAGLWARIRRG